MTHPTYVPPSYGEPLPSKDAGIVLRETCFACPQQYEGTVDGNPAYFRLRHSSWRFCIVEPGGNPIGPGITPDKKVLYYNDGEVPGDDVGCMGPGEAEAMIEKMVKEFRDQAAAAPTNE